MFDRQCFRYKYEKFFKVYVILVGNYPMTLNVSFLYEYVILDYVVRRTSRTNYVITRPSWWVDILLHVNRRRNIINIEKHES